MASLLGIARGVLALLGITVIAACANNGGTREQRNYPQSIVAGDVRFDVLAPQELGVGRCGLFLWAQNTDAPLFIFTAYDNPAQAHVRPNGRERILRRTAYSGAIVRGHFEQQTYSDARLTVVVDVRFNTDQPLRDGAAIERGVLRIRDDEGWETIVPVGGILACGT